jgi:hypothetical protein
MYKTHFRCYFYRHFILKMTAMISDNLTQDTEPGDNLVEYEKNNNLPIGFHGRNGFDPLGEVVNSHDNVLIPPSRSWFAINEIYSPLSERTDSNDWVERGRVREHFLSKHPTGVTLLNFLNTIFKYGGPEVTVS